MACCPESTRRAGTFPLDEARRWYVLQTKPRQESRVIAHLGPRTSEVQPFLPKIETVRRRAGRRVVSHEPMFPSYLFLRMPFTPATWNAVRWAPGARRLLGAGERPVEVPEEFVQEVQERIEPHGFISIGMTLPVGSRVRVKTGPFAGLECIFERPTGRDRVRILLEMLGRVTPLEIEVFDLERL